MDKLSSLAGENTSFLVSTLRSLPVVSKSSYADIASNDLAYVVKSAVADTFSKQKSVDRGKSSIAISGMPEDGHDYADLSYMLEYLESDIRITSYIRIGHEQRNPRAMRPRILKVELSSQLGRDQVLK